MSWPTEQQAGSVDELVGNRGSDPKKGGNLEFGDDVKGCTPSCVIPELLGALTMGWGVPSPTERGSATTGNNNEMERLLSFVRQTPKESENFESAATSLLEQIFANNGMIGTIYLPTSNGRAPSGKKCKIRCKMGDTKVEVSVRIGGELKKFKFEWQEVTQITRGRGRNAMPPPQKMPLNEKLFVHMKIQDKGDCEFLFDEAEFC